MYAFEYEKISFNQLSSHLTPPVVSKGASPIVLEINMDTPLLVRVAISLAESH